MKINEMKFNFFLLLLCFSSAAIFAGSYNNIARAGKSTGIVKLITKILHKLKTKSLYKMLTNKFQPPHLSEV